MAYIFGGLLALLIIFSILKGLFSSGPVLAPILTVAQDQQEIIHLVSNAAEQQGVAKDNLNFAATTQLSLTTAQSDIIQYLAINHLKLSNKKSEPEGPAAARHPVNSSSHRYDVQPDFSGNHEEPVDGLYK